MKLAPTTLSALVFTGAVWAASAMTLTAQERATTQVTPGQAIVTTQVDRAEVVYVSGNELVVKTETGEVRHLTVPDSARANVDGKTLTIRDLKPGMKLQRTITTTQTPKTVTTIRTVTGKVFSVNAPLSVILSFPDAPNKQYKVPNNQVFTIDGEKKTVFDLKKGMTITANVVTESQEVELSERRVTTGTAPIPPPAPKPLTPPPQQVLLIETPLPVPVAAPPAPAPTPAARPAPAPEPPPVRLPKTASPVPMLGMLGLLFCVTSLAFRATRR
jgi:hypothetical protein